jgi:hypothetical protein
MRSVMVEVPLEDLELLGFSAGSGSTMQKNGIARAMSPKDND